MAATALGTPIKASKPTVTISKQDIMSAIKACEEKIRIDKLAREADKNSRANLTNIFSKIFPEVKFFEDIARISPEQIEKALGSVTAEMDFIITKTSERRIPSWKDEFIAEKGELAALEITKQTDPMYSYKIVSK